MRYGGSGPECLEPGFEREGFSSVKINNQSNSLKKDDSFFLILKRESDEKTKKEDAARPKNSPFEWL
jgi:hypothetical protein